MRKPHTRSGRRTEQAKRKQQTSPQTINAEKMALLFTIVGLVMLLAGGIVWFLFLRDDYDIERIKESVVHIVFDPSGFGMASQQGSGVIWHSDGYVMTAAHVVETRGENPFEDDPMLLVNLYTPDAEEAIQSVDAEVIGISPCDDLALLRLPDSAVSYPAIRTDDIVSLRSGDSVRAFGYPLQADLGFSEPAATRGDVSRTNVSLNGRQGLIEHQATVHRGNSGGPLFTAEGRFAGINIIRIADGLFYAMNGWTVQETFLALRNGVLPPNINPVAIGEAQTGEVNHGDHINCYTFRVAESMGLTISVVGELDFDPFLRLYQHNLMIAENDDISRPENLNSSLEVNVEAEIDYLIAVRGIIDPNQSIGRYTLQLTPR